MTLGYWLDRARESLRQAREGFEVPAASHEDTIVAVAARSQSYHSLARLMAGLSGCAHSPEFIRSLPQPVLDNMLWTDTPIHHRLLVALQAAAGSWQRRHLPGQAVTPGSGELKLAADALTVAADILASNMGAGVETVRTPEGEALQGSAVEPAYREVAQITALMVRVDRSLTRWLAEPNPDSLVGLDRPALYWEGIDAASWVLASRLPAIASEIARNHQGQPGGWRTLAMADEVRAFRDPIASTDDSISVLLAARNWMFREPQQVRADHLRFGVRTGLAIGRIAVTSSPTAMTRAQLAGWGRATEVTEGLGGIPPDGVAQAVARDLREVYQWVRQHVDDPGDPSVARLAGILPGLARVLIEGADRAIHLDNLFARRTQLVPVGQSVRRVDSWEPVTRMLTLRGSLRAAAGVTKRSARIAFPRLDAARAERGGGDPLPSSTATAGTPQPRPGRRRR